MATFSNFPSSVLSSVKSNEYDIVHCHSPFPIIGSEIARRNKVPFIATFHSKYGMTLYQATKNEDITDFLVDKIVDFYTSADQVGLLIHQLRRRYLSMAIMGLWR